MSTPIICEAQCHVSLDSQAAGYSSWHACSTSEASRGAHLHTAGADAARPLTATFLGIPPPFYWFRGR